MTILVTATLYLDLRALVDVSGLHKPDRELVSKLSVNVISQVLRKF